jgi:hypothetical protein
MNLKVSKKIRYFLDEPGDGQLLNHSRVMKCGGGGVGTVTVVFGAVKLR